MFSRGIRGITIDNNISAVAAKEDFFSHSSLTRQLLFSDEKSPNSILATPSGEAIMLFSGSMPTEHSKLTVYGVCMNKIGAKIYKQLEDNGISVVFTSFCDIAASFIISTCNCERAIKIIKDNFTLEL